MGNENIDVISLLIENVPVIALLFWIVQNQAKRLEAIAIEIKEFTAALNDLTTQLAIIDSRQKEKDD